MKKISYLLSFLSIGLALTMVSCEEGDNLADQIEASPNLIGFAIRTTSFSGIADGTTYTNMVPVSVFGPSTGDLSGSYTATITVDPSSTAVEGTHFTLPSNTITVTSDGNLASNFQIDMLSAGIPTPLAVNPVIVLKVGSPTGSGNIVASGATLKITLLYLCPSFLADFNYAVTGTYVRASTATNTTFNHGVEGLSKVADGEYFTETTGHWNPGELDPGYDGFYFKDICGVITIEEQNLGGVYSNLVQGTGTVDESTGDIYMEYTVCASDCREYTATYVQQ